MPVPAAPEKERQRPVNTPTSPTPSKPLIAIDGPAGAGKSTIARLLANRLGVPYLDTGAMYRVVGVLAAQAGIEPPYEQADGERITELIGLHRMEFIPTTDEFRVEVDGEDWSGKIRSPEAAAQASAVSALSAVRRALVPLQRRMASVAGGVMEGRDIGSVVLPGADLKVFLTASPQERARRRLGDLQARGMEGSLEEIRSAQDRRDLQDTSRGDSPLQVPRGAVVVDGTQLTPEQVVERVLAELEKCRLENLDSTRSDAVKSRNHGRLAHGAGVPSEEERF